MSGVPLSPRMKPKLLRSPQRPGVTLRPPHVAFPTVAFVHTLELSTGDSESWIWGLLCAPGCGCSHSRTLHAVATEVSPDIAK